MLSVADAGKKESLGLRENDARSLIHGWVFCPLKMVKLKQMLIKVKVKPNSRESSVKMLEADRFLVCVKSKAERGEANKETAALLADHLVIPESKLRLKKGRRERSKIFEIIP